MKMYNIVLIFALLAIAIPDYFFYRHLKKTDSKPFYIVLHLIPTIFFSIVFIYMKFGLEKAQNFRIVAWAMWFEYFFLLLYIPKLIHILFYFLHYIYQQIFKKTNIYFDIIRIILSIFVVVTMLISAYITPRNFEVTHIDIPISDLPKSFEGYKIVQISDLHLGSWNQKYKKLEPVIRLVNQQQPDIIVFTGDMVNNYAAEGDGWKKHFDLMTAKSGKYAVLGNHDYGDYTDWATENQRNKNRQLIKQHIRDFGFSLLLNRSIYLHRGQDSIQLTGVENWGKSAQWRYSKLSAALQNQQIPTILLSHDPNQWDAETLNYKNIQLTLSGHTHAAQLGLKIGDYFLSPASLVFKRFAGLYSVGSQYLYVNRGIGYIGLPMSIGVRPEITVITLHRKP